MLLPTKIRIIGGGVTLLLSGSFFVLVASADMEKQGDRRRETYALYREEATKTGEMYAQMKAAEAERKKAEEERRLAEEALKKAEADAQAKKEAEILAAKQALLLAQQKEAQLKAAQAAATAQAATSKPTTKRKTKSS